MALDTMIQYTATWLTNSPNGITVDFEGLTVKVRGFFIRQDVEIPINFDFQVPPADDDGPDFYHLVIADDNTPRVIVNFAESPDRIWIGYANFTVEPGMTDLNDAEGFIIRFEPGNEYQLDGYVYQEGPLRDVYLPA